MPDRLSDLLCRFLRQNRGTLSRRGRTREFAALTGAEIVRIESLYREVFLDPHEAPGVGSVEPTPAPSSGAGAG